MNILIIEDDKILAKRIQQTFERTVITNRITVLYSYEEFVSHMCDISYYDIILTDIWLNSYFEKNWLDIVKYIRKKNNQTPIVMISAYNDISMIQEAFKQWANDYLVKPFRLQELEIRALRWFNSYFSNINMVQNEIKYYGDLSYSFQKNEFYHKNKIISLTKKQKFLLFLFFSQPDILLKEEYLLSKLWGDIYDEKQRNLRVVILRLKKSLQPFWVDSWLTNVRWEWYIFQK